ncbi:MAG: DUF5615 family PIN-like protein [Planctomycetaceae bacterium]
MRIDLDDDSIETALVRLLRVAGHDVRIPSEAAITGAADPVHLTAAIRDDRVFLTCNCDDFEDLHDLVLQAQGHHPGILVVRQDNDPRRDLSSRGIVTAISRYAASGLPIADQFVILNHWR